MAGFISRVGVIGSLLLTLACPADAARRRDRPSPPPRPVDLAPTAPVQATPVIPPASPTPTGSTCLSRLIGAGAVAQVVPAPSTPIAGCGIASPVRLSSVTLANGDVVTLPDQPILDCEFATTLADFLRVLVAPLGAATFGAKVTSVGTGPGYECRGRNRMAGAKVSAHGAGLAADITTIDFSDKRRVSVERHDDPLEATYFRAVRAAACGWFTTVLGPGADAFHANNMHVDVEQHGSKADYRICQ